LQRANAATKVNTTAPSTRPAATSAWGVEPGHGAVEEPDTGAVEFLTEDLDIGLAALIDLWS
jgi:hypothetical protein